MSRVSNQKQISDVFLIAHQHVFSSLIGCKALVGLALLLTDLVIGIVLLLASLDANLSLREVKPGCSNSKHDLAYELLQPTPKRFASEPCKPRPNLYTHMDNDSDIRTIDVLNLFGDSINSGKDHAAKHSESGTGPE